MSRICPSFAVAREDVEAAERGERAAPEIAATSRQVAGASDEFATLSCSILSDASLAYTMWPNHRICTRYWLERRRNSRWCIS